MYTTSPIDGVGSERTPRLQADQPSLRRLRRRARRRFVRTAISSACGRRCRCIGTLRFAAPMSRELMLRASFPGPGWARPGGATRGGRGSTEAADGVSGGLAFGLLAIDVVLGLGVTTRVGDGDAVKRGVDLAVAAGIEAVAVKCCPYLRGWAPRRRRGRA